MYRIHTFPFNTKSSKRKVERKEGKEYKSKGFFPFSSVQLRTEKMTTYCNSTQTTTALRPEPGRREEEEINSHSENVTINEEEEEGNPTGAVPASEAGGCPQNNKQTVQAMKVSADDNLKRFRRAGLSCVVEFQAKPEVVRKVLAQIIPPARRSSCSDSSEGVLARAGLMQSGGNKLAQESKFGSLSERFTFIQISSFGDMHASSSPGVIAFDPPASGESACNPHNPEMKSSGQVCVAHTDQEPGVKGVENGPSTPSTSLPAVSGAERGASGISEARPTYRFITSLWRWPASNLRSGFLSRAR